MEDLKDKGNADVVSFEQPAISSRPSDWNGFDDPVWNIGQLVLWVATRDPKFVDGASDACGELGNTPQASEIYGLAAASILIADHLTPALLQEAAWEIKRSCVAGKLKPTSKGCFISPAEWTGLSIFFKEGVLVIQTRENQTSIWSDAPNLRFLREEILRNFPDATFTCNENDNYWILPGDEPRQAAAATAYRALKHTYPNGRVPKRHSAQWLSTKMTNVAQSFLGMPAANIGRDDIRRALGRKK